MSKEYIEYRIKQGEIKTSPYMQLFEGVWEKLQSAGHLEGLSDEEALERVVSMTENIIEGSREPFRMRGYKGEL